MAGSTSPKWTGICDQKKIESTVHKYTRNTQTNIHQEWLWGIKKNYKMPSQIHQIVNSGKFRKESQEYLNRNESEQLENIKMFI